MGSEHRTYFHVQGLPLCSIYEMPQVYCCKKNNSAKSFIVQYNLFGNKEASKLFQSELIQNQYLQYDNGILIFPDNIIFEFCIKMNHI